eukprot:TRINITY_DN1253_c0_g1_i2.p1 TRINITY_DN1253_c0_g1~~TRINITY_DN1253_c0_g1_i2.p1  ORF type:complete len:493 (+),score=53.56 TRINITY_DN1253_c0_g1_i2:652-2130(+)
MCRSSKVSSVYVANVDKVSSSPKLCELRSITAKFYSMNGTSLGTLKRVLPDSGASANLMGKQDAERLGLDISNFKNPVGQLTAANNLSIDIIGEITLQIEFHDIRTSITFQVSSEYRGTLLSLETSIVLGIIHPDFPAPITAKKDKRPILHVNGDTFESIPAETPSFHKVSTESIHRNVSKVGAANFQSPKEPLQSDPLPNDVFQEIGAGFFEIRGKHYLALVDRYSNFIIVHKFPSSPTAKSLINSLLTHIATFGRPLKIFSDGGRQFTAAETQDFFTRWGITHRLSSPHFPQSNGLAESAVKSIKTLLLKTGDTESEEFQEALLELRNTPLRHGTLSPAQIVFGRPMRSRLPAHNLALAKDWQERLNRHDTQVAEQHKYAKNHYNSTSSLLKSIPIGSKVWIQNPTTKLWDRTATVQGKKQEREYLLLLPSGRTLLRNRRFLRILKNGQDSNHDPHRKYNPEENGQSDAACKPQRPERIRFAPNKYSPSQ